MFFLRFDFVEPFDSSVNTIIDRFMKPLDHGSSGRTFLPYNLDARRMNDFSHMVILSKSVLLHSVKNSKKISSPRAGEDKGGGYQSLSPPPLPRGVKSSTPQGEPSPVKGEGELGDPPGKKKSHVAGGRSSDPSSFRSDTIIMVAVPWATRPPSVFLISVSPRARVLPSRIHLPCATSLPF